MIRCSVCNKQIKEGFVEDGGNCYCSEDCIFQIMSIGDFMEMIDNGEMCWAELEKESQDDKE